MMIDKKKNNDRSYSNDSGKSRIPSYDSEEVTLINDIINEKHFTLSSEPYEDESLISIPTKESNKQYENIENTHKSCDDIINKLDTSVNKLVDTITNLNNKLGENNIDDKKATNKELDELQEQTKAEIQRINDLTKRSEKQTQYYMIFCIIIISICIKYII